MPSLGKRMAKGAAWMVLFKFLERSVGLISTLVLARLLVPADFGVVAMAISVIAILEVLSGFSFDIALIQKQDAERRHYDAAWTLNILTWSAMAVVMVLVAGPIAAFYREPRVEHVLYVLAIGILVTGFENIGIVAFQKDLTLNKDFYFLITKKIVAVATGIAVAVIFRSYWALVAGIVASRVVGVILSYFVHPFRPRLSLSGARELIHFSRWLFVLSVLGAAINRAPDFIIGRIAGPAALGVYNLGFELSNLPTSELVQPVSRAVFPGYAKMANDPDELRKGFLAVVSLVALVAIPAAAGIAMVAEPLVHVLLGAKWLAVIPIIHVLASYGLISSFHGSAVHLLIASGHPRIAARLAVIRLSILVPALLVGAHSGGVVGAAYGALLAAALMLPLAYAQTLRLIGARPRDCARLLWRPLLAAGTMMVGIALWQRWLGATGFAGTYVVDLVISVCVGVAIYAFAVLSLWRVAGMPAGAESQLLAVARSKLRGSSAQPGRA